MHDLAELLLAFGKSRGDGGKRMVMMVQNFHCKIQLNVAICIGNVRLTLLSHKARVLLLSKLNKTHTHHIIKTNAKNIMEANECW